MDIEKIVSQLTLEEKASLCSGSDFWHTQPVERLGIPGIMMCDGPNGLRKQKGEGDHMGINESISTVCYPTASAMASSFDTELLGQLGEALGEECQAENVGMLLGPGLNMKRSPLCGRNFEYFSEDPYLAGKLGAAYIRGLQGRGVASCVKHFAANNQETLRMTADSQMDERTFHEIYLPAFEAAVKEGGARSVMCAYNRVNGTFCAENKELLNGILRDKWGFDGMVVTDWGAVKDRVKGLEAGLDLEMPGGSGAKDARIVEAVRSGQLQEEVLDRAVRNILNFVEECLKNRQESAEADREAFHGLSARMAAESAVLLKNESILPLKEEQKIAFIGEFAQNPRYQGAGSSHINVEQTVSAMEAAEGLNVVYARGYRVKENVAEEALLTEAQKTAREADCAVIFAGLPNSFETEGADRDTLSMPDNQIGLIRAVAQVQPNTVVVLHGGAPMELPFIEEVKAVLCMYLGGDSVGRAAVDLLYGRINPSGKLAETWPLRLVDNPSYLYFPGEKGRVEYREGIYMGYRYYDKKQAQVLFPFGYGLSYTSFAYSGLELEKSSILDTEKLKVTCRVKNTGSCRGKEVVQLYVRDVESTVGRPVRELKGFAKVWLEPGEEKEVSFLLDKRSFAYYSVTLHDWHVESGEFRVEIGSSSRDIRLEAPVMVESTEELPMTVTANTTMGELAATARGRAFMAQMMAQASTDGRVAQASADGQVVQAPADGQAAQAHEADSPLGEGSEVMVQKMMQEMPLGALVSYGRMTQEQLDSVIAMLNA